MINAFAMTSPATRVEQWLAEIIGIDVEALVLALLFVGALVILPLVLIGGAAAMTRLLLAPGSKDSIGAIATRQAYALIPFGFAVWFAHYSFHLLTGALTIVPVFQSAMIDFAGMPVLGEPVWTLTGAPPGLVFPIQLGCLVVGTMGSLAVARRISVSVVPARPTLASLPWASLIMALAVMATWTLSQPMEMRATGLQG